MLTHDSLLPGPAMHKDITVGTLIKSHKNASCHSHFKETNMVVLFSDFPVRNLFSVSYHRKTRFSTSRISSKKMTLCILSSKKFVK